MPAASANSIVRGVSVMRGCSHNTNITARVKVRTLRADYVGALAHNANMARRGIPKGPISWYLPEWMEACGLKGRGAQAKMIKLTGWSKATMSQLYNGTQDYSPAVIRTAATALNVREYELLMHPDEAMMIRRALNAIREVQLAPVANEPHVADDSLRKVRT